MATTINFARFSSGFSWSILDTVAVGSHTSSGTDDSAELSTFGHGTTAGLVDRLYVYSGTLAASATLALDFSGAMVDTFGNAFVIIDIAGIYFRQQATASYTSTSCSIGAGATFPVVPWTVIVPRGGTFQVFSPTTLGINPVTPIANGANDTFRVINLDSVNAAQFTLAVIGTSV